MRITNIKYARGKIKKGFTLIELLVVIAVIGILATLALVSYGGIQSRGRDVRRKSDLNQYRIALENYALRTQFYPARRTPTVGGGYPAVNIPCNPLKTAQVISDCPQDPKLGVDPDWTSQYLYLTEDGTDGGTDATTFVLWADLENGGLWVACWNGKTGEVTPGPNLFNWCKGL